MNIKSLLEDLAGNDSEEALKFIYFAYSEKISRYIFMYTKSKEVTEEILSDVFYTIWEKRKLLPQVTNFNTYIYSIAKFKSLNYIREQKITTINFDDVAIELFGSTKTTAEEEYISKEMIEELNSTIEGLPVKCKLAFKLVKEDNMKYKDAAEHLGISVKTLEIHLTSAMKKIRTKLKEFNSK
ncbi:RNA polymerase sigma factor [Prevotella sp. 10(H)]|uniref:RNA polymerase sigma factor n=1 Tax=Prevotella sp. 10(H) TaxID=1158294 RepID=UPI0004A6FEEB|nr:sigma-70 family RNA polymerase sigma factor [Prevotella sp. 10(H)]